MERWIRKGQDIDGEAGDSGHSGHSVALSADGTRVAIGAIGSDSNGSNSGHVRIYDWNGTAWVQQGQDIDGEASGDKSGWSVALSADGTRVAIGARYNDGNGSNSGHVRVYEWNGTIWVQKGEDIDGEAAGHSGFSVALSSDGTRMAIGAPFNNGNGSDSGHVRIYDWSGAAWVQQGQDITGETASNYFGWSVSLSSDGTRVAIGARLNNGNGSNSGHVRIYDWSGAAWVQKGQDIDGEAAGDQSGWSVALSAYGTRVAIGAHRNRGHRADSGHVRIYDWDGAAWVQKGQDIDGEDGADLSGHSVSLSADGTRVAIGAINNDAGRGYDIGHVRVYDYPIPAPLRTSPATGISTGDPYVYPMLSKIPVKLPDKEACYRLYQDGSTFVNAEVTRATPEHQERMKKYCEEFFPGIDKMIVDGFFYSKFFIATDGDIFLFDLKTKKCFISLQDKNEKFSIKTTRGTIGYELGNPLVCGMANQHEISWTTKEGTLFCVTVSFYDNPNIENGISITVDRVSEKALGLCVKNYRPKLMTIPNVLTDKYDKLQRRIMKSNNPFQQKLIKLKNENWYEKPVKVNQ